MATIKQETIIKDMEKWGGHLKVNPSGWLKLNSTLRKLPVERVYIHGGKIRDDTYCKDLTLFVYPEIYLPVRQQYLESLAYDELSKKGGVLSIPNRIRILDDPTEERQDLQVEIAKQKITLASYLPNRNIIMLYFPIIEYTDLRIGVKNQIVYYYLEELEKFIKKNNIKGKNLRDTLKDRAIKKFLDQTRQRVVQVQNEMRQIQGRIQEYESTITGNWRRILECQKEIEGLGGIMENMGVEIKKHLEEIRKLKFIKRVGLSTQGIRMDYEMITMRFENEDLELGECSVWILPNKITIKNKQAVKEDGGATYHSPHIMDGTVCFGSDNTKVFEMLGKMDLKRLAHFLYLYLKTYNTESTYCALPKWKRLKEEQKKKKDGAKIESEDGEDQEEFEEEDYNDDEEELEDEEYD